MKGDIEGFSLCRNGPKVTHLFFFFLQMIVFYFVDPPWRSLRKFKSY